MKNIRPNKHIIMYLYASAFVYAAFFSNVGLLAMEQFVQPNQNVHNALNAVNGYIEMYNRLSDDTWLTFVEKSPLYKNIVEERSGTTTQQELVIARVLCHRKLFSLSTLKDVGAGACCGALAGVGASMMFSGEQKSMIPCMVTGGVVGGLMALDPIEMTMAIPMNVDITIVHSSQVLADVMLNRQKMSQQYVDTLNSETNKVESRPHSRPPLTQSYRVSASSSSSE